MSSPGALAFGPDGNLYVLDTGNNRIASFDTNGNYLGSIMLDQDTTAATTALAIGANGWLYTANGDGGGTIYDIYTGQEIGSLASTAVNLSVGEALLAVGGDDVYLYDASTGLHVFDDGAETPEPASWMLFGVGLGAMMLWRRLDNTGGHATSVASMVISRRRD